LRFGVGFSGGTFAARPGTAVFIPAGSVAAAGVGVGEEMIPYRNNIVKKNDST
jgi:hypothetical protein